MIKPAIAINDRLRQAVLALSHSGGKVSGKESADQEQRTYRKNHGCRRSNAQQPQTNGHIQDKCRYHVKTLFGQNLALVHSLLR